MSQQAWNAAEKEAAITAYVSCGNLAQAQQAAKREDGTIPGKTTIKRWTVDAGHDLDEIVGRATDKTQQATRASQMRWQDRRSEMLDDIGFVADEALTQTAFFIAVGNPKNAKDAATCMAILIDKAQVLSGDASSIVRLPWDPEVVKERAHIDGEKLKPRLATSDGEAV